MKVQDVELKRGDKFLVGEDTAVYWFHSITINEDHGFLELNAICPDYGTIPGFRIDTMEANGLYITKL